jgi:hypothetical protein
MRMTFGQLKTQGVAERVGLSRCSDEFRNLVNRAMAELSVTGRWWGTYEQVRICPDGNCFTWPYGTMTPERLNVCKTGVPVRNGWWEFQMFVPPPQTSTLEEFPGQLLARPNSPLFSDISTPSRVRIYITSANDVGKRVLIQGADVDGKAIYSTDAGVYIEGEYVTLANPFATTTATFSSVTGVIKPDTEGPLRCFEVPTSGTERQVGEWHPSDNAPSFLRTYYTGNTCASSTVNNEPNGCTSAPGCGRPLYEAIVRKQPIPIRLDTDWLLIPNPTAVEHYIRGLRHLEADRQQLGTNSIANAIRLLRAEVDARSGGEARRIIRVHGHGPADPRRTLGGMR